MKKYTFWQKYFFGLSVYVFAMILFVLWWKVFRPTYIKTYCNKLTKTTQEVSYKVSSNGLDTLANSIPLASPTLIQAYKQAIQQAQQQYDLTKQQDQQSLISYCNSHLFGVYIQDCIDTNNNGLGITGRPTGRLSLAGFGTYPAVTFAENIQEITNAKTSALNNLNNQLSDEVGIADNFCRAVYGLK